MAEADLQRLFGHDEVVARVGRVLVRMQAQDAHGRDEGAAGLAH